MTGSRLGGQAAVGFARAAIPSGLMRVVAAVSPLPVLPWWEHSFEAWSKTFGLGRSAREIHGRFLGPWAISPSSEPARKRCGCDSCHHSTTGRPRFLAIEDVLEGAFDSWLVPAPAER